MCAQLKSVFRVLRKLISENSPTFQDGKVYVFVVNGGVDDEENQDQK